MKISKKSGNIFLISSTLCLMLSLNSTGANAQYGGVCSWSKPSIVVAQTDYEKLAQTVEAVNMETNTQFQETDNTKAIVPSGKYRVNQNEGLVGDKYFQDSFCYCRKRNSKGACEGDDPCLNCSGGVVGEQVLCNVYSSTEENGYNVAGGAIAFGDDGFVKGYAEVIQPGTKDGKNNYITKPNYYKYWNNGAYSPAYPVICYKGFNGVAGGCTDAKNQFGTRDDHDDTKFYRNLYNKAGNYVMSVGLAAKDKGLTGYDFEELNGGGCSKITVESWKTKSVGGYSCLMPKTLLNNKLNDGVFNINQTHKYDFDTGAFAFDSVKGVNITYDLLPCGGNESSWKAKNDDGYEKNGVCNKEYLKIYNGADGKPQKTIYTAWLLNSSQGDKLGEGYETFDVEVNNCYTCKPTSDSKYCEEVIRELGTYCNDNLECIVKLAVLGGKNMQNPQIAEGRLPSQLNCGGCLSQLETIIKTVYYPKYN